MSTSEISDDDKSKQQLQDEALSKKLGKFSDGIEAMKSITPSNDPELMKKRMTPK